MAKKERNKRSARKARAQERAEREAQQQASQAAAPAKSSVISKVASSDKPAKSEAKKGKKTGLFTRFKDAGIPGPRHFRNISDSVKQRRMTITIRMRSRIVTCRECKHVFEGSAPQL